MKSASPFALPAAAAKRMLEIAQPLNQYGWVAIDKLNKAFLADGGSPAEYGAGIAKLKADGLVTMHPSGTRLYFTEKGAQRLA